MYRGGQIEMKEGNNTGNGSIFLHIRCLSPRTGCKNRNENFLPKEYIAANPNPKPKTPTSRHVPTPSDYKIPLSSNR
jgi:hypothetical protein